MVLQGILGMLSAINGEQFFLECYTPLGEVIFTHNFQIDIFENNMQGQTFHFGIAQNNSITTLRTLTFRNGEISQYKCRVNLKCPTEWSPTATN